MANKKGAGVTDERYVGTCRFFIEVSPTRRSQLEAAMSTEQQQMEVASGGDITRR